MIILSMLMHVTHTRAYRLLKEKRACTEYIGTWQNSYIIKLKIVQILNMHSEIKTAAVSMIS